MNTATTFINFNLRPVEIEAGEKIASMMVRAEAAEQSLLDLCSQRLSASQVNAVKRTLLFAKSLESTNASHPSMRAYLSHPIRVAKLALQLQDLPAAETASLGLLHNVFEVTGLREADLFDAGFGKRLAGGIRLMTVNRERQFDETYLKEFYASILAFGDDLALVKCVDKLDNLLAFQLFDGAVRDEYLETTNRFVTPLAARLSPRFGEYFAEVVDYMRSVGCDQELKAQYEAAKQNL